MTTVMFFIGGLLLQFLPPSCSESKTELCNPIWQSFLQHNVPPNLKDTSQIHQKAPVPAITTDTQQSSPLGYSIKQGASLKIMQL